jgi:N-carbamoyl-L-amino-acid hydrolase
MKLPCINKERLWGLVQKLAEKGAIAGGGVCRLALSDADKEGRDLVVGWMRGLGLTVRMDQVGNIMGTRPGLKDELPVVVGSHLDTVSTGGLLDGAYGVLAGLEVVNTLNDFNIETERPVMVMAFTNEEGARYTTVMMGSKAFCGELSVEEVWAIKGLDGSRVGEELHRIGYAGDLACGVLRPCAYLELHVEQGPMLERAGLQIGIVEAITGVTWLEITIRGVSNHAGTTPMDARHDPGLVASRIVSRLPELASSIGPDQRLTCGRFSLAPGAVNVIPQEAVFTVDLRNGDEDALQEAERRLIQWIHETAAQVGTTASIRSMGRTPPVRCASPLVKAIERSAKDLGYPFLRMLSGACHDAQIMASVCPAAMIFIPSRGGISHSPAEYSSPDDLQRGANVLFRAVVQLANE